MSKNITLCRYFVKSGEEAAFTKLLEAHWPTMTKLGLVSDAIPHLIFRGEDKEKGVFFVESFAWRDEAAMNKAHELDEVMAIWGPMGECCSSMEFPSVTQIKFD